MLAVPSDMLDMVRLKPDSAVNILVENGRLIIEPTPSSSYALQELLKQCDPSAPMPNSGSNQWTQSAQQGLELL
jgi:hypothetical protein